MPLINDIERATLDAFLLVYPQDMEYGVIVDALETGESISWITRRPEYEGIERLDLQVDEHHARLEGLLAPYRVALRAFTESPHVPKHLLREELRAAYKLVQP